VITEPSGRLGWINRAILATSRRGAVVTGWVYLVMALLIALDVITRRFGFSTQLTDEVAVYGVAIASAWAMAHALIQKDHVRVEVLLVRLPRRVQAVLNLISVVVLTLLVVVLAARMWRTVLESAQYDMRAISFFRTPLVLPQLPWALGFSFFVLVCLVTVANAIIKVRRGRTEELADDLGPRAIASEVAESVHV